MFSVQFPYIIIDVINSDYSKTIFLTVRFYSRLTMAEEGVPLIKVLEDIVDDKKCVICQASSSEPTSSTENGRKRIWEAASVREDCVSKRLKLIGDKHFVYHVNNQCYKSYTHKKTVEKLKSNVVSSTLTADKDISVHSIRSKTTPREKPTVQCKIYDQKCVICGFYKYQGEYGKCRISEINRASKFLEASVYFQDEVFTRTCDLQDTNSVFGADLYCHKSCISNYLLKYDRAKKKPRNIDCIPEKQKAWRNVVETIESGLSNGLGYELSFVRNSINEYLEKQYPQCKLNVTNREVKLLLVNHFGGKIYFSQPKQVNKSLMFFSQNVTVEDVAQTIRNTDPIKECAQQIRKSLLDVDFNLNDRFCDAADLEESLNAISIPDPLLNFFAVLFNFDKNGFKASSDEKEEEYDVLGSLDLSVSRRRKLQSLFQIMYFNVHNGRKRTPLHIMNSEAIYESCKSATLITSFNHLGLCVSYQELMRHQTDMATYSVKSSKDTVPFPSHFNASMFTMAAIDNFDHDEATLSGIGGSHDTVTVLFQDKDHETQQAHKPRISETGILHGPKAFNINLPCQQLKTFYKPSKKADLPENYTVPNVQPLNNELLKSIRKKDVAWILGRLDYNEMRSYISTLPDEQIMPIWSAANSILSDNEPPLKRIAFLPVLPYPITQFDVVYTAMKNLQRILTYLDQHELPVTCDEGVFRIAREIQLIRPEEFNDIVLCLGSFHMTKIALGCLGKYLKGSGAENILIESGIFGVNVIDSVLSGKNYVRSLKGLQLLKESFARLQWVAFFKEGDNIDKYQEQLKNIAHLRCKISQKLREESLMQLKEFETKSEGLIHDFDDFVSENSEESETFRYWSNFILLMSYVENLIRSDREGNWPLQLQSIQNLLPLFAAFDSTNYLRWCSLYLEDMYRLPNTAPTIHQAFMEGKFVIKQTPGRFKAVGADMALEQTINRSQKSPAGIIGSSRRKNYVAKWEITYHEVLAITNLHRQVSGSGPNTYELDVNQSFAASKTLSEERNIEAIIRLIERNENPFLLPAEEGRLRNIMTNEVATDDIRKQLLNAESIGKTAYEIFRKERFSTKEVRISATIHRTNLKTFASLHQPSKFSGKYQQKSAHREDAHLYRMLDVAKERGHSMEELLQYDICSASYLFDEDGLMTTTTKSSLVHELEKQLKTGDQTTPSTTMKTGYIVDVMANIRKMKTSNVRTFGEFCSNTLNATQCIAKCASKIYLVFDSYFEMSIKDSERRKRQKKPPIELHYINKETPLPVEMDRFWPSITNKTKLESLLHQMALDHPWKDIAVEIYVSNFRGPDEINLPSRKLSAGLIFEVPELNSDVEEADLRCIVYALHAIQQGCNQLVILSSDTDVLILFLYYWNELHYQGCNELWIKTGSGDSVRYIPIHTLAVQLGREVCQVLPAVHSLTGCDYTSKFGTKFAALKTHPEMYLKEFGTKNNFESQVIMAEEYLTRVLKQATMCKTTDHLRSYMYHHSKRSCFKNLPPTSYATKQHIKRAYFATYHMISVLSKPRWEPLDPTLYCYEVADDLLVPTDGKHPIPEEFTVMCSCTKCGTYHCSCRGNNVPCCSFCKCRSGLVVSDTKCKNPLSIVWDEECN